MLFDLLTTFQFDILPFLKCFLQVCLVAAFFVFTFLASFYSLLVVPPPLLNSKDPGVLLLNPGTLFYLHFTLIVFIIPLTFIIL